MVISESLVLLVHVDADRGSCHDRRPPWPRWSASAATAGSPHTKRQDGNFSGPPATSGTGSVSHGPFCTRVSTQPAMSASYLVYSARVDGVTQLNLNRLSRFSCGSVDGSMAPVA